MENVLLHRFNNDRNIKNNFEKKYNNEFNKIRYNICLLFFFLF